MTMRAVSRSYSTFLFLMEIVGSRVNAVCMARSLVPDMETPPGLEPDPETLGKFR